jgi:hypothetical protein
MGACGEIVGRPHTTGRIGRYASIAPACDNLSVLEKLEIRKDTVQVAVESAFNHVGQIAAIVSSAGREVTRELGEWATEVFEMREAARRADADRDGVVEDRVPPYSAG